MMPADIGHVFVRMTVRQKHLFCCSVFFLGLFLSAGPAQANGLSIANVSLTNRNTTSQTIAVQFDISWNNSWLDSINNDAVWIFIKYSQDGGTTWNHATLQASGLNPSGFSRGTKAGGSILAMSLIVPSDRKGCFIQPAYPGSGTFYFTQVQLLWAYGLDGISNANIISANSKVRVFGIEMVYVPTGGFYAGDTSSAATLQSGSSDTTPWFIPNENAIHTTNCTTGCYYYNSMGFIAGEDNPGTSFWLSGNYPKGYHSFYLMKYEVSQQQYVDFLNTLTRTQQESRVASNITADSIPNNYVMHNTNAIVNRDTINCPTSGNGTTPPVVFTAGRPSRAANYLSWMDLMAYAEWAALRPMSELEFEKAARGPVQPVSGEFAWGSTSITACTTISGTEDGTETCSTGSANANFGDTSFTGGDTGTGPLRVGIFATASTTTRAASGAGFYGNLDLSGSVWERAVTIGNPTGRTFLGTHGTGTLATDGNATNADWPGYAAGEITGSAGSGLRGGAWFYLSLLSTTSFRYYAAASYTSRDQSYGGRLARTGIF